MHNIYNAHWLPSPSPSSQLRGDEEFVRVTRKKYLIDKKHDENSLMTKIEFQLASRGLIQKHLSKGNMSSVHVE